MVTGQSPEDMGSQAQLGNQEKRVLFGGESPPRFCTTYQTGRSPFCIHGDYFVSVLSL